MQEMKTEPDIKAWVDRWFQDGDTPSLELAYGHLLHNLSPPPSAIAAIGIAELDEIRQEVLIKLLDRTAGKLHTADKPLAYARKAFHRAIISRLRTWSSRRDKMSEIHQNQQAWRAAPSHEEVDRLLDLGRALAQVENLEGKGRLALLLTIRPDRLTDEAWQEVTAMLPPPPPPKPVVPISREKASRLLFPPLEEETAAQERQRLNSFDRCVTRAHEKLRRLVFKEGANE